MQEVIRLLDKERINPAVMATHICVINTVIDITFNLTSISLVKSLYILIFIVKKVKYLG